MMTLPPPPPPPTQQQPSLAAPAVAAPASQEPPSSSTTAAAEGGVLSPVAPAAQVPVAAQMPDPFRHLRVRDLSRYLERLKGEFPDDPDVYGQFFEAMMEAKHQTIDTPGLIDRITTLLRGHPSLIQGFGDLLPPGYQLEPLGAEGDGQGLITVVTPAGTVTQTAGQFSAGLAALEPATSATVG